MSVDLDWQRLTGGSEGAALAEQVRAFVHDKFQSVPLPRFVRSVQVHAFDFGRVAPTIEIKDICDPLPDFYEDDDDDDDGTEDGHEQPPPQATRTGPVSSFDQHARSHGTRPSYTTATSELLPNTPFLSRAPTPGILGGASNLGYFQFSTGTTTPLAAVAGAQFPPIRTDSSRFRPSPSLGSGSPPSVTDPGSRPPSQHVANHSASQSQSSSPDLDFKPDVGTPPTEDDDDMLPEPGPNDIQVVSHVRYSGDVKLVLTASILLDYPMPSFVEIPVKLHITGITFDGISILAYIRKKAHLCFLAPADAESLFESNDLSLDTTGHAATRRPVAGGLLEQIKVESEIGQKESGKQVLKNVGKVERFILEQVRRIFEEEFVYPSFWTFLV